jgi:carbonic anhydrase
LKKLISGIIDFRKNVLPQRRDMFAKLAAGQAPDVLLVTCSDSRVAPNWFASTDPGDLFVIRNVGNLIPSCGEDGHSSADESEAAAIEFALINLKVSDIIVCGHSDCGAMHALLSGREKVKTSNLRAWLRHGEDSLTSKATDVNQLSQLNVLKQLEHLKSYPMISERLKKNKLRLHAWWFELNTASVYAHEESQNKFVLIDEEEAQNILSKLEP